MKVAVVLALAALLVPQGLEVGKDVPDLKLKSVDGKECSVANLSKEGKVIAIVSWSVDCPSGKPCIPRATEVAKKFADNSKVVFVGISSYGDSEDKIKSYAKDQGIGYPIVCDSDRSLGKALGAKKVNSAYVIKDGKLFWRGGITKDGKDPLADAIQAALDGKPAPASDNKFAG
jgi:peroxiredoxin